jgi:hypothetical protein
MQLNSAAAAYWKARGSGGITLGHKDTQIKMRKRGVSYHTGMLLIKAGPQRDDSSSGSSYRYDTMTC